MGWPACQARALINLRSQDQSEEVLIFSVCVCAYEMVPSTDSADKELTSRLITILDAFEQRFTIRKLQ